MLQRYRISGRDRNTGESIDITVQAESIEGATAKAIQRNISVESIALEQVSSQTPPLLPPFSEEQVTQKHLRDEKKASSQKSRHRWCLLVIGFTILVVVPAYPIISLLFGASILFLCFGVFIPQVKDISYRLIEIDPTKRWKKEFRLTMYGMIGFFFILFAWSSFEMKAEEQRVVAQQAAAKAESQRLAQEANNKVAKLASEAENIWIDGNKAKAIETIEQAEKIPHATNLTPVHNLRVKMANSDVSVIMSEAVSAAESGELDIASERVERAIAVPNATELEAARQLKEFLALVRDSERVKALLLRVPDEELAVLQGKGTIPNAFVSGYAGLDRYLAESAHKEIKAVVAAKENLKREEEEKCRIRAEAEAFVNSGLGKKVPFEKWNILGVPKTLDGTDNRYWVAYLDKANVSFVSEKSSDMVIFVAFGEKKATEFLAEKDKKRKEQLESQFSAWDGSHRNLTKVIKASMNDPDSYKHVETVYWDMGDYLVVQTTFRGKNAFGGVVTNWVKAKVDLNGNVFATIEQGP